MKHMVASINRYLKIYWIFGSNVLSVLFQSRLDFALLFLGKLIVFYLNFLWLFSLFNHVDSINFYTREQIIMFFAVFNIIDRGVQLIFYRSLWFVPQYIYTGDFDRLLTMPVNSKFIASFRQTDWNDMLMLVPSIALFIYAVGALNPTPSIGVILGTIGFMAISVSLAYSLILIIAATAFRVIKVDSLFLLYRDLMRVSQFPPEIYGQAVSMLLLFVIPVLTIVALPAKFVLGIAEGGFWGAGVGIAAVFFILSNFYWNISLRKYSSASS